MSFGKRKPSEKQTYLSALFAAAQAGRHNTIIVETDDERSGTYLWMGAAEAAERWVPGNDQVIGDADFGHELMAATFNQAHCDEAVYRSSASQVGRIHGGQADQVNDLPMLLPSGRDATVRWIALPLGRRMIITVTEAPSERNPTGIETSAFLSGLQALSQRHGVWLRLETARGAIRLVQRTDSLEYGSTVSLDGGGATLLEVLDLE